MITVDGAIQALDKYSGQLLWQNNLGFPMIGSFELENSEHTDDAFIPMVDGSLIRFDKEGILEVSINKQSY